MPIFLSTTMTDWVSLELDRDIPESARPAFEVRVLGKLEADALAKELDNRTETLDERRARVTAVMSKLILSVKNMGGRNVADTLADLTDGELEDLAGMIYATTRVGYDLLKKSKLPRASTAGSSVATAGADAKTPPAP